ncbi:MAG: transporter substrate-binding protein [Rhodospirillales bacterium]|nr:transporter substrate-binding protein [Rhodospirillales bacterium]
MTIRRTAHLALAILALAGTVSVCATQLAHAADPYEITAILPLTGGASFLGKSEQQSIQLATKTINEAGGIQGRPLQINFQDDQSSPQTAVQLANQAIASKPAVIMGSALVAMCNAMAPLMQNGPVMYCLSPGVHPAAGSYIFTTSVSTRDLAQAIVRYFRMKGWTKIALLTSTDASGQDAEQSVLNAVKLDENKGVELVAREHFNPADVAVSAQIENVKAAQPQAFIAWSTGAPVATIFKGIVQAGLDIPIATTDGNMTHAQMDQYAAFLPKQLYIPAAKWVTHGSNVKRSEAEVAAQAKFDAAYKAASVEPDVASAHGWDPTMMIAEGLRKLGTNATAAQLHEYFLHLKGFEGINGNYDFEREPQRGLDVQDAVVTLWDPAKKNWIPVSQAAGAPLQ